MSPAEPAAALEPGVRRPAGSALRVVLHVGAFKTGTTYVQNVLWNGREELAAQGALFAGRDGWVDQVLGVRELLGLPATSARQEGAWQRLVGQVAGWPGTHAMVSMEYLSLAGPPRARRLVTDLAPADVRVVLTARDLGRVVPASWQERVKNGNTWTWTEYVDSILHTPDSQPGRRFWRQQDLAAVARRWSDAVGPERVTVVTVPPSGADPAELLARIGAAAGLDASRLDPDPEWGNPSLGAVQTEALRRVNVALGAQAGDPAWVRLVKQSLAPEWSEVVSRRLGLTAADLAWVEPLQRGVADRLATGGWRVVGDLADLAPTDPRLSARPPDDVDEAEVADAVAQVAAALGQRLLAPRPRAGGQGKRGAG